jgi:geranylgeranyl reductase family protein
MFYDYDVIVVGGGPAGTTAALFAKRAGLNVLLVDKKHFPRDKICGDAISGKSIHYLTELGLFEEVVNAPNAEVHNIVFSSPNEKSIKINFTNGADLGKGLSGFICRRLVFDNILFQAAKKEMDVIEGLNVKDITRENGQVLGISGQNGNGEKMKFTAKITVGADGFNSIVSRKMNLYDRDPRHWLVATRAYYKGVTDLNDSIELHYVKETLPGYFWIFPADNGLANVGIGMVYKSLKKKGISIRQAHINATESEFFRKRFENAVLEGDIRGWNLPTGSKRRKIHGDGFILLGDAAGLIDPFTGEGIGNAMCSGYFAAQVLQEACDKNDFSANFLRKYPKRLWRHLGPELTMYTRLQQVGRIYPLINLVVGKASKSREVLKWLGDMIVGKIPKTQLLNPLTYLKLLAK